MKPPETEVPSSRERCLTGAEAADFLGVKPATLYAYVSRGLLESVNPGHGRERSYKLSDLINLRNTQRGVRKSEHTKTWAGPLIKSAITDIREHGHYYRGKSSISLALSDVPFERVVELLWDTNQEIDAWYEGKRTFPPEQLVRAFPKTHSLLDVLKMVVLWMETSSPLPGTLPSAKSFEEARRLIITMAGSLAFPRQFVDASRAQSPCTAAILCKALTRSHSRDLTALINRALVLCADHELNASTLAARIAASCGANIYSCVLTALGAFRGPLHGSASQRLEEVVQGSMQTKSVSRWLKEFLEHNKRVPGFGMGLYPQGDPRAKVLLDAVRRSSPSRPELRRLYELIDCVYDLTNETPTIDAGLAAVSLVLSASSGSGGAIFAVGRSAGWIAHAVEQSLYGAPIRPRARYIGK